MLYPFAVWQIFYRAKYEHDITITCIILNHRAAQVKCYQNSYFISFFSRIYKSNDGIIWYPNITGNKHNSVNMCYGFKQFMD